MPGPALASGDIWSCAIVSHAFGQEFQNVLHLRATDTVPDLWDVAAEIETTLIEGAYVPAAGAYVSFDQLRLRGLIPYGGYTDWDMGTPGDRAGEALPGQVAAVISQKTASILRTKRGRLYVYGQVVGDLLDSQWTDAYMSLLDGMASKLIGWAELTALNVELGVWSRKIGGSWPPGPPFDPDGFEPVINTVSRRVPGTFRTRRFGRGV